jgi:hypothetical protein
MIYRTDNPINISASRQIWRLGFDTIADISELQTEYTLENSAPGSTAKCVATGEIFMLNSRGEWILQPSGGGGGGHIQRGLIQAVNANLGDSVASIWTAWDTIAAELNSRLIQPSDIAFLRMRNRGDNYFQHDPGAAGRSITINDDGTIMTGDVDWIRFNLSAGAFVDFLIRDAWYDEREQYDWTAQKPTFATKNHPDPRFMMSMAYEHRIHLYPDSSAVWGQGLGSFSTLSQQVRAA